MKRQIVTNENDQKPKPKVPVVMEYTIRTTEDMLGSSPCDPGVYATYIASRKLDENKKVDKEATADEIATLPEREVTGWSVYHEDEKGLFIFDYHLRGFLKEAARNVTGKDIPAVVSKIDRWVFISPRRLYLRRNGKPIKSPDDMKERPLKAMTMQGPRVSLKRSDSLTPGVELTFNVTILPLGAREITQEHIGAWLEYGQWQGLGEWRNASHGRFEVISNGNGKGRAK